MASALVRTGGQWIDTNGDELKHLGSRDWHSQTVAHCTHSLNKSIYTRSLSTDVAISQIIIFLISGVSVSFSIADLEKS